MKTGKQSLLKILAITALIAHGALPALGGNNPLSASRIASDAELAEIRGGYVAGEGLEISFGIEKSVTVNGILQAVNTLNLPHPSSGDLLSASQGSLVKLIQSGVGNTVDPSVLAALQSGMYTFVQNSLDLTTIKNVTQINATVNVQNLYRNMNLNTMLSQQMIHSLR